MNIGIKKQNKTKKVLWLSNYQPQAFVGALDHLLKDTSGLLQKLLSCFCLCSLSSRSHSCHQLSHTPANKSMFICE